MKFTKNTEITKAIDSIKQSQIKRGGKRIHYPILFKKALITYMKTKQYNPYFIHKKTGINYQTIKHWLNQFDEGLYEPDGAYCVSRISKTANTDILKVLKQQVHTLLTKIELVKQCKALGLKVTV